jgi:hypothetical protein
VVELIVIGDEGIDLVAEFRAGFTGIDIQPVPIDGPPESLRVNIDVAS